MKESERDRRKGEKEKPTPDDAGADKTANDKVYGALGRLFLTFRDNLVPRLLPPSPGTLPGDFIRLYFLALCRERETERKRERERERRTVSRSYPRDRSSHAYQRVLRKVLRDVAAPITSEINRRSIARTARHIFRKLLRQRGVSAGWSIMRSRECMEILVALGVT